jgi:phosphoglycerate dehydrogenase-like enzyme
MRLVVAIHDPPAWTIPPAEVARLAALLPDDEVRDAREAADRRREFPDAEVLFATRLSAEEFAAAPRLRWVHSSAVGVGGLLPAGLVDSPIPVSNSRGVHSDAIAEHAIALVLGLRRHLHTAVRAQTERRWVQEDLTVPVVPARSATNVLVVGLGSIGVRVAALAAGLGFVVSGVRRRPELPVPDGVSAVFAPDRLLEALADADVVILATPRTEDTRAMIGAAELRAMKPTALFVNVARGRLADEAALIEALRAGRLGGAGLDAFVHEPLPADSPLWGLPNVLITPHTAAFSGDYWTPVVDLFVENLSRFKRGQPLLNLVDKRYGY